MEDNYNGSNVTDVYDNHKESSNSSSDTDEIENLMQVFDEIAYAMIEEYNMFNDISEDNYRKEEFNNEEPTDDKLLDNKNENISQLEIKNFINLEHKLLNNDNDNIFSNSDVINHSNPNFD
ncbi:15902_t:CDS:2, partial [Racocetra fulgida]